jgi:hypothetical protein
MRAPTGRVCAPAAVTLSTITSRHRDWPVAVAKNLLTVRTDAACGVLIIRDAAVLILRDGQHVVRLRPAQLRNSWVCWKQTADRPTRRG